MSLRGVRRTTKQSPPIEKQPYLFHAGDCHGHKCPRNDMETKDARNDMKTKRTRNDVKTKLAPMTEHRILRVDFFAEIVAGKSF